MTDCARIGIKANRLASGWSATTHRHATPSPGMPSGPERARHELVEQARRALGLDWEEAVGEARDEALGIIERHGRTGQTVADVAANIVAGVDAFQAVGSE